MGLSQILELTIQKRGGLRRKGVNEITISEDRLLDCQRKLAFLSS